MSGLSNAPLKSLSQMAGVVFVQVMLTANVELQVKLTDTVSHGTVAGVKQLPL